MNESRSESVSGLLGDLAAIWQSELAAIAVDREATEQFAAALHAMAAGLPPGRDIASFVSGTDAASWAAAVDAASGPGHAVLAALRRHLDILAGRPPD